MHGSSPQRGLLFTLFLATVLASAPVLAAKRRALLVGANTGWGKEKKLEYAHLDAAKLRDALIELGGFTHDDITLLEDPRTDTVRQEMEKMRQRFLADAQEGALFVFYYSGHADPKALHLSGEPRLSYRELRHLIGEIPTARKLVILDACGSGGILNKGAKYDPGGFPVQAGKELAVRGTVFLASSGANEPSLEARAVAGSFFTHHLVSGLRGAADANRDLRVSVAEAYQHSSDRTRADTVTTTTGTQNPGANIATTGHEEFYLTYLKGAATVVIPPDWLRCAVTDRHERRVVAEFSQGDPGSRLAIPPGPHLLKCMESRTLRVARFDAKPGQEVMADQLEYRYEPRPSNNGFIKGVNPLSARILLPVASGAALLSSGVLWTMARKEQSLLRRGDPSLDTPEKVAASVSRGRRYQGWGVGLAAAGAAGLGISLYVLLAPSAPVVPVAGPDGAAVIVQGRWP